MAHETLQLLDEWYKSEPSQERPKLISKLALLELCGWLENWMDDFVLELSHDVFCHPEWIQKQVIKPNHGFNYSDNFRQMVAKVVGEYYVCIIESRYEASHPGELERLKNYLGQLKPMRHSFAHNQYNSPLVRQEFFYAPSALIVNFYTHLHTILSNYRLIALSVKADLLVA